MNVFIKKKLKKLQIVGKFRKPNVIFHQSSFIFKNVDEEDENEDDEEEQKAAQTNQKFEKDDKTFLSKKNNHINKKSASSIDTKKNQHIKIHSTNYMKNFINFLNRSKRKSGFFSQVICN